jgi:selenide,water dikinase
MLFTVDFFTPIVDDPSDWGRIAAANAMSDIFAMGGIPIAALNILAWPRDRLDTGEIDQVLAGGEDAVRSAGALVVGGHSIDDPVPKYGLAVLGTLNQHEPLRNSGVKPGHLLLLTKPIGVGAISTAAKHGVAPDSAIRAAVQSMVALNSEASAAAVRFGASACTDISGFGLLGHMREMLRASKVAGELWPSATPIFPEAVELVERGFSPTGARRNEESVSADVSWGHTDEITRSLMCDPQTSGGLLIAGEPSNIASVHDFLRSGAICSAIVGKAVEGPAGGVQLVSGPPT